jgi:RNA polymerase sigma-70 factor (ECF subfamily)
MSAPAIERVAEGTPEHALREPNPSFEAESWALVARVQAGDKTAYGELWDRYKNSVFLYLRFRMRDDRQTVEDLTSETFARGLKRINTLRNFGKTVGAWFVTIARNIMLDHFKRASTVNEISCSDMLDAHDRTAEAFYDPEQRTIQREGVAQVLKALATLSVQQREVLILRHFRDLSVEETRQIMGGDAGRIKAMQHRAMMAMRRRVPEAIR